MLFKRTITKKLEAALQRSPVVLLIGARQTGKTTLMHHIAATHGYTYISFDDARVLSLAQQDPITFIRGLPKPVILDEVQRVPEIFLTIKHDVDQERIPGKFLLTGSANPLLLPRLGDSLAGRMEILSLLPLSQGEILGTEEHFIDFLFNKESKLPAYGEQLSREALCEKIIKGGYPSIQGRNEEGRTGWFNGYITSLLERDVVELSNIEGLKNFPNLLSLLATRAGGLLNTAELSRLSTISSSTLHRYLTLLEKLFLINLLQPWSRHLGLRLIRSPKLYLVDSGLLTYLLSYSPERLLCDSVFFGGILENFVIAELLKQMSWSSNRVKMHYFRTQTGIEVDVILENSDGEMIGIEIKSGEKFDTHDFKGLKYLQEKVGDAFVKGIILYAGTEVIPYGRSLIALPISSLWQNMSTDEKGFPLYWGQ